MGASLTSLTTVFTPSPCPTCPECDSTCPECVECDPVYENEQDYCRSRLVALDTENQRILDNRIQQNDTKLSELDTEILNLKDQKTQLESEVSSQATNIETLNRWLHCETSTDENGYRKADGSYDANFKGKPYWENQLAQCNEDTGRYNTERENCETWLGVCNQYLAPYCESGSGNCGDWWTAPAAGFDSDGKHCTDPASTAAYTDLIPPLPSP